MKEGSLSKIAVLKNEAKKGELLPRDGARFPARGNILPGHKIALLDILDRASVRQYGQIIGFAKGDIPAGDQMHSPNLKTSPGPDIGQPLQTAIRQ